MPADVSFEHYDRLVQLAYQDALAPRPWKGFVSVLANTLQSRDASLHIYNKRGDRNLLLVTNDEAPYLTPSYFDDMLGAYFLKEFSARTPMTLSDFGVAGNFRGSALFKRFLAPIGVAHILTQDVYEDNQIVIRLSLDRERGQGDFGPEEKRLLQSITPHVRQALHVRNHVQEAEGLAGHFQDLLAKTGVGCIVLGPQWEILRINGAASQLLQGDYGFSAQRGQLRLHNTAALKKVRLAIDAAVAAHREGFADLPGVSVGVQALDGNIKLNVVIKPLVLSASPRQMPTPAVMLLLNDGGSGPAEIDADLLAKIYNLTRCEARVGVLLVKGYTLREVADKLHVSINTVKTHQQGIYDKLGLNRRSQVINLLTNCTAKLM